MANGLYDSGKPKKVEMTIKHEFGDDFTEAIAMAIRTELAKRGKRTTAVTITPQFERVEERKKLK